MYLKRHHDITISSSGVWRIVHKVGLSRLPASQRYKRKDTKWKRYEKQRPGHALQVDVKFIEPLGQTGKKKRYYRYTAIDDCTRVRVLRAYPKHDQKAAIMFIDHVLSKLPFKVDKVQTDNGSEFGQSFHSHVLDKGINHVYIKPATPRLNGKVERSHRIDSEEFYRLHEGQVIDDVNLFNDKLQQWRGLLQLRSTPRRPRRRKTLPTPETENTRPAVIGLRQLHPSTRYATSPVRGPATWVKP